MSNKKEVGKKFELALGTALFETKGFEEINQTIENLGNHTGTLTDKEKEFAVQIVGSWERNVLEEVQEKKTEIEAFIQLFKGERGRDYYIKDRVVDLIEEYGEELAEKTNTVPLFEAYLEARKELKQEEKFDIDEPIINETMSVIEEKSSIMNYELEVTKHKIVVKKLRNTMYKAEREWLEVLEKNPLVASMLEEARRAKRKLAKMDRECKKKSDLAKLNITISNEEMRKTLKELMKFSIL